MKRTCDQCSARLPVTARRDSRFCSGACRQKAYRRRSTSIPSRMRREVRWTRAAGKRPTRVSGAPASSTDATTWETFRGVQAGAGDGYGIMLGGGLACWDLDHCFEDGRLAGWAQDVLAGVKSVYAERSMSGEGLHVFVEAPEGPGWRRGGVEFYSRSRFIRVTGDRIDLKEVF